MTPPDKTCASCGRTFSWRRKWARSWEDVRYCSDACRRQKVSASDHELEDVLRRLLAESASVDPTDAARAVGDEDVLREAARRAARRIVAAGDAELTQRGRVVDPATVRGPFELRRR